MEQESLWHDSLEDALRATVDGIGGPKHVAHGLWPSRKLTDGARYLNHCLDCERPEKLALGEILWIAGEGRAKGVHTFIAFLAGELGYSTPQPIEPADEQAELQRQFNESVAAQRRILNRMEKLVTTPSLRGVS